MCGVRETICSLVAGECLFILVKRRDFRITVVTFKKSESLSSSHRQMRESEQGMSKCVCLCVSVCGIYFRPPSQLPMSHGVVSIAHLCRFCSPPPGHAVRYRKHYLEVYLHQLGPLHDVVDLSANEKAKRKHTQADKSDRKRASSHVMSCHVAGPAVSRQQDV